MQSRHFPARTHRPARTLHASDRNTTGRSPVRRPTPRGHVRQLRQLGGGKRVACRHSRHSRDGLCGRRVPSRPPHPPGGAQPPAGHLPGGDVEAVEDGGGGDREDQGGQRRLVVMPGGLIPDLVGYRVHPVAAPGDGFGDRQRRALGVGEVRRIRPLLVPSRLHGPHPRTHPAGRQQFVVVACSTRPPSASSGTRSQRRTNPGRWLTRIAVRPPAMAANRRKTSASAFGSSAAVGSSKTISGRAACLHLGASRPRSPPDAPIGRVSALQPLAHEAPRDRHPLPLPPGEFRPPLEVVGQRLGDGVRTPTRGHRLHRLHRLHLVRPLRPPVPDVLAEREGVVDVVPKDRGLQGPHLRAAEGRPGPARRRGTVRSWARIGPWAP